MTRFVRAAALCAGLLASSCGHPARKISLSNVQGLKILMSPDPSPDALVSMEAVERYGRFDAEGECLVLTLEGQRYTPAFPRQDVADRIIKVIGSARSIAWEIQGRPMKQADSQTVASRLGGCPKNIFSLTSVRENG